MNVKQLYYTVCVNGVPFISVVGFDEALSMMNHLWLLESGKSETSVEYADNTHSYIVIRNPARPFTRS